MATNYREILRLAKLGYSQRSIAASAGCARSTVQRVLERAESNPHTLEELLALSDKGIQQALFPASSISSTRKAPDYTATPNYKTIQMILKTGSDLLKEEPETKGESYAFTRGAAYYGGGEGKC